MKHRKRVRLCLSCWKLTVDISKSKLRLFEAHVLQKRKIQCRMMMRKCFAFWKTQAAMTPSQLLLGATFYQTRQRRSVSQCLGTWRSYTQKRRVTRRTKAIQRNTQILAWYFLQWRSHTRVHALSTGGAGAPNSGIMAGHDDNMDLLDQAYQRVMEECKVLEMHVVSLDRDRQS